MNNPSRSLRLLVLPDFAEERWPSMDLCAQQLLGELARRNDINAEGFAPKYLRRVSRILPGSIARNADRLRNRMKNYPAQLRASAGGFDAYHLVDHSYSQLLHDLPAGRVGVYCHDLDTFACLLDPQRERRPKWFCAMTRRILDGFVKAAVVFHSTDAIKTQIRAHGLIDESRLVKAPLGVANEFFSPAAETGVDALTAQPYLLHVGSCIPRKRIDVLLSAFEAVGREHRELRLIQVGGEWDRAHRVLVDRIGAARVTQLRGISRAELAWLYHRALLVLLPSEAEGFGLPLVEALASGARVVASDLAVLREVGGEAAAYCKVGDVADWVRCVGDLLAGRRGAPAEVRRAQAAKFSWAHHAEIIASTYLRLFGTDRRPR